MAGPAPEASYGVGQHPLLGYSIAASAGRSAVLAGFPQLHPLPGQQGCMPKFPRLGTSDVLLFGLAALLSQQRFARACGKGQSTAAATTNRSRAID